MPPSAFKPRDVIAIPVVAILGIAAIWFVVTKVGRTPSTTEASHVVPLTTTPLATTITTTSTTTVPPPTVPLPVPPTVAPRPPVRVYVPPQRTVAPVIVPPVTDPAAPPYPVGVVVTHLTMTFSPPAPAPAPALALAGAFVRGLPDDAGGCTFGVCISLESRNGEGQTIVAWGGSSTSLGPCAQLRFLMNGIVVAETSMVCRGSGQYSALWTPDAQFPLGPACVRDLYAAVVVGDACETIESGAFGF